uniref:G_PROTEIN_RECEP_F1_2 domain-containing protein n=1 Tax=Caenorhabditis tropicalis TaxID=1561998 RepID=A0A1I7UFI0_9PELO
MYIFSTTTLKPLSTTKRWNGRDPTDYYFFHGGPDEYWDTRDDYLFEDGTVLKALDTTENIYYWASYIGLFLNLLHFFVLTRKELRSNVVFIIMIGICFSDLLVFFSTISERYFGKSDEIGYREGWCGSDKQWWWILIELCSQAIQKYGRLSSAILVFFMASIRSFSVIFPMSSMINILLKTRTGVITVLATWLFCGGWYWKYYAEYFIRKPKKFKEPDNTSMLVVMMAVSFFISEVIYCFFFVMTDRDNDHDATILQLADLSEFISKTILILNSILHCFICFFLSSQYREVARRVLFLDRAPKRETAHPKTRSAAVGTTEMAKSSV